jgi:hypothetical protein
MIKPKKPMSAAAKKAKGRRLQQIVAKRISELTGLSCGKDGDVVSREMGQNGVDIRLSPKAREIFPWSIECKNQETWKIPQWIEQAKTNIYENTNWLLIVSKNNYKPIIILDMEVFFNLLKGINYVK